MYEEQLNTSYNLIQNINFYTSSIDKTSFLYKLKKKKNII